MAYHVFRFVLLICDINLCFKQLYIHVLHTIEKGTMISVHPSLRLKQLYLHNGSNDLHVPYSVGNDITRSKSVQIYFACKGVINPGEGIFFVVCQHIFLHIEYLAYDYQFIEIV